MSALTRWWPGGRDDVALGQRPAGEAALQRLGRALQPDIVLRRREHHARRRLRLGLADLDEVARADAGIGALQAVEADDVEPFVLAIGADRARRGRALADDLDRRRLRSGRARCISLSGSRAMPRPLSPGGRLATCTRRVFARSTVSVSAICLSSSSALRRNRNGCRACGSMWEPAPLKRPRI